MAKKKKRANKAPAQPVEDEPLPQTDLCLPSKQPTPAPETDPSHHGADKHAAYPSAPASSASPLSSSTALPPSAPRNKSWRNFSAYYGSWTAVSVDVLEVAALVNYNTPRPRPLDPAMLFDLVKIRRSVEEATDLAVRAASDTASSTLSSVNSVSGLRSMSSLRSAAPPKPGHGMRMSRERRLRMRELAVQKLARAYRLDDIAACIVTMQGTTSLDDLAGLVLQDNPRNSDAKFVHFFHDKIISRDLTAGTEGFRVLEEILEIESERPELLRTLAALKGARGDLADVAADLTRAMSLSKYRGESHGSSYDTSKAHQNPHGRGFVELAEDERPSGLDGQLIFHRGAVLLLDACEHVLKALGQPLDSKETVQKTDACRPHEKEAELRYPPHSDEATTQASSIQPNERETELLPRTNDLESAALDKFREVKALAKQALRDIMLFLKNFDYSPTMPVTLSKDYNDRMLLAAKGVRKPRSSVSNGPATPHKVYTLADLFSPSPPTELPEFPSSETLKQRKHHIPKGDTCESVTYHPLLSEALHSLLFCHCLAQTSVAEIRRHAYMVARLVRLFDGYPIFHAAKSSARTDWEDMIRRGGDWLGLGAKWQFLCEPAPLPGHGPRSTRSAKTPDRATASAAAATLTKATPAQDKAEPSATACQAALEASLDHNDGASECAHHDSCSDPFCPNSVTTTSQPVELDPGDGGWDGATIVSARATAVRWWIQEVPFIPGVRRKRRARKIPSRQDKGEGSADDDGGGSGNAGKVGEAAGNLAALYLDSAGEKA
ncbi:hypothetical protein JDV02_001514 [Purpureocillium takamizusanense]|uniref:Histidine kinase group protein n=1 Tax=Purpureocillium takamizusanense TaxID=2060973 RepID=A0A9Q8Q901_9HYPO|nr:uncharacterized protein JDV02_001514 [Purpureocillium takamizusanense]UNI14937.1 hypothetical protein JDV02_001514 [Purpureocillium takamizusanense]